MINKTLTNSMDKQAAAFALPFEALAGDRGTLANGVNWSITNNTGQPLIYSATGNGDIRTEGGGPLEIDFDGPVTVELLPINDPALLSPDSWTYQSAPSIFPDRATTDGNPPVYEAGSVDAMLENVSAPTGIQATTNSQGVAATSNWGKITLSNLTSLAVRQRNNSALKYMVRPL